MLTLPTYYRTGQEVMTIGCHRQEADKWWRLERLLEFASAYCPALDR